MRQQFECPRCQQANELGRIFCVRCGAKLDFTRPKVTFAWGSIFATGAQLLFFLAVLTVVGLAMWPLPPAGRIGGDAETREWLAQRDALKTGTPVTVSEAALNAYLATTLKLSSTNATGSWRMDLAAINVAFQVGSMTVVVVTHWGPLTITWTITGVPQTAKGHLAFDVRGGSLGHLPLPSVAANWLAGHMAALAARWPADVGVLDHLFSIVLESRQIKLDTQSTRQ